MSLIRAGPTFRSLSSVDVVRRWKAGVEGSLGGSVMELTVNKGQRYDSKVAIRFGMLLTVLMLWMKMLF